MAFNWESIALSTGAANLALEIENKLKEEDWLITEWSPVHLKRILEEFYFKDGKTEVSALTVYQNCCHYLYLPRLLNDSVFKAAINQAIGSKDYFGFAAGKDGDQYLGFCFGKDGFVSLDEASLLIEKVTAEATWQALNKPAPEPAPIPTPGAVNPTPAPDSRPMPGVNPTPDPDPDHDPVPAAIKRQFFASCELDSRQAKLRFSDIYDEIIEQFTARGISVKLSLEIEASHGAGFDEGLQRTIKENCIVLKFNNAEFEE